MDIEAKDLIFVGTQVAIVTAIIINNRANISYLNKQHEDLKDWIKALQEKVDNIRVKVGI